MTPHFVLHVGPHKTGTTYLQSVFTIHHALLREKGIQYPIDQGSIQGHFHLAALLREGALPALRDQFALFRASGAPTILLSSESLVFLDRPQLGLLRDLIAPSPVTVVFYCRRPSEILLSGWREVVKHGVTTTLPEFLTRALTGGSEAATVNLSIPITRLAGVFGVDRLRLVPYNTVLERGANLFQHFCAHVLDWADAPEPTIRRMNPSLSMADAELLRMINVLEYRRVGDARERLYERFVANRPDLGLEPLAEGMTRHVTDLPINEQKPPFLGWHRAVIERFGAALTEGAELFTPKDTTIPYIRPDYLAEPGIIDRMHALHARLLALPNPDPWQFTLRYL